MKKVQKRIIIASVILVIILIIIAALTSFSTRAIIKNKASRYYKAKIIFAGGKKLFCLKSSAEYKSRPIAFKKHKSKTGSYSIALISLNDIREIYLLDDPKEPVDQPGKINPRYLGSYKIIASGHRGFLYLWSKNGRAYGSVRFPNWAKGKVEYLKWVSIKNNRIRFVRSATTVKELRRIGASSYFTQRYTGFYSNGGRTIKGYYYSNGKNMWEAKK